MWDKWKNNDYVVSAVTATMVLLALVFVIAGIGVLFYFFPLTTFLLLILGTIWLLIFWAVLD